MPRVTRLSSPMLLGFEQIESLVQRAAQKSTSDGYPPYNIERLAPVDGRLVEGLIDGNHDGRADGEMGGEPERLRITLAVAGFAEQDLEITIEDSKLLIRGRQSDDSEREFIYRGIAARQFQRTFVLAEGMEVRSAGLENGLLSIDLVRLVPDRIVRRIEIGSKPSSN